MAEGYEPIPREIQWRDYNFEFTELPANSTTEITITRDLTGANYAIASITPIYISPTTWSLIWVKSISTNEITMMVRNLNTTTGTTVIGGKLRVCYVAI